MASHKDNTSFGKLLVNDAYKVVFMELKFGELNCAKKSAFTLAEVLITLAIIGVVAALTIPTLIIKYQEKATVSKVLKTYYALKQAYQLAKLDKGEIFTWFNADSETYVDEENVNHFTDATLDNMEIFFKNLQPYLKGAEINDRNSSKGKFTKVYTLNGDLRSLTDREKMSSMSLSDGTYIMSFWAGSVTYCRGNNFACADFSIDINGPQNPPNTIGKDIFYFIVTAESILPMGYVQRQFMDYCDISSKSAGGAGGYSCTRWIVDKRNMDYLHCSGLTWDDDKCP